MEPEKLLDRISFYRRTWEASSFQSLLGNKRKEEDMSERDFFHVVSRAQKRTQRTQKANNMALPLESACLKSRKIQMVDNQREKRGSKEGLDRLLCLLSQPKARNLRKFPPRSAIRSIQKTVKQKCLLYRKRREGQVLVELVFEAIKSSDT